MPAGATPKPTDMKTAVFALAFLLAHSAMATVLVVDPFGGPGTYPDFPTGYAQAVNGDTIEVRPLTQDLSSGFTLSKSIPILGFGYPLFENYGFGDPSFHMLDLTLSSGVEVVLESIEIRTLQIGNNSRVRMDKVRVTSAIVTTYSVTDIVVIQSEINQISLPESILSSVYIQNSFVDHLLGKNFRETNLLVSNSVIGSMTAVLYGYFINSIINSGHFCYTNSAAVAQYSVVSTAQGLCDSTNTFAPINTIYALGVPANADPGHRYSLAPNSPAIGAGYNGVDCGIFGGPTPYELSGLPSRPWIYELMAPPATTNGAGPMPVVVKVKAVD